MTYATIVIVASDDDRAKRACYVEVDGVRVAELATSGIERRISYDDASTTLTFGHPFVRWEEAR